MQKCVLSFYFGDVMIKVYDFDSANEVISQAWKLAINHLETTLGDQYNCNATEDAMCKFWDCIQQDIKYKKICPHCKQVDSEANFMPVLKEYGNDRTIEVCYDCYKELKDDAE